SLLHPSANPPALPSFPTRRSSDLDRRDLADVALGVGSADAAAFLLRHLRKFEESHDKRLRYIHHIARHGGPGSMSDLLQIVETSERSPADKLGSLRMIQQGMQERGQSLSEDRRKVAHGLARSMLVSKNPGDVGLGGEAIRDFQF